MYADIMTIATFSNEDENEDEDCYDRLGPGTRTSSTEVHGGISAGNKNI